VDHGPILAQEARPVLPATTRHVHERIKAVERRRASRRGRGRVSGHGVSTALLSVYDKAGVVELASGLHDLGGASARVGGTARVLAERRPAVTDVAELTGFPAILGHRV
jgi:phosphoribosylaminoimidazolecarboxamide formyltransferase/IMP cyclohydrolase